MPKWIAARHFHTPALEHEHAGSALSGHEQRLTFAVALHLAEAEEPIDFRSGEFWKHLFIAGMDPRHGPSLRVQHNPIPKVSSVSASRAAACAWVQERHGPIRH